MAGFDWQVKVKSFMYAAEMNERTNDWTNEYMYEWINSFSSIQKLNIMWVRLFFFSMLLVNIDVFYRATS